MKQLQTLNIQDLEERKKLFTQNWPKYCTEVYCLNFFIDVLRLDPNTRNFKAYTLKDQELGLYLIVDRYQLFIGCLEKENYENLLEQALRQLDWSKGLQCTAMPTRYLKAAQNIVDEKQLELEFRLVHNMFYLKQEKALNLIDDTPSGFYLKALDTEDAHLIDDIWLWSHPGSLYLIQRQISMCLSVGIYREDTNELIAWCMRAQEGHLAALCVTDSYKRRGFGHLLVSALAKRIAQSGQDITAEVITDNKASSGLFNKLGFQIIDQCFWLNTKPTIKNFIWPDGE